MLHQGKWGGNEGDVAESTSVQALGHGPAVARASKGVIGSDASAALWPVEADFADDRPARSKRSRAGALARFTLLAADAVGLALAFTALHVLSGAQAGSAYIWAFLFALGLFVPLLRVHGLHDALQERGGGGELGGVLHSVVLGTLLLIGGAEIGLIRLSAGELLLAAALAVAAIPATRSVARAWFRARVPCAERTVIVGAGEIGRLLVRKLGRSESDVELLGFVDAEPLPGVCGRSGLPHLGTPAELARIVETLGVDRVVIAFSNEPDGRVVDAIRSLDRLDVRVEAVPRLFEVLGASSARDGVDGVPLVSVSTPRLSPPSRALKRTLDIALAFGGLILLAPFFALVALLIKLESRGPVFFRQERVGRRGRPFHIYKFRTMVDDADARKSDYAHLNKFALEGLDTRMFKIPDDPRVTRIGRFLRRYSLDELPQLINVVRGEMSVVGPRPLIPSEDCHVHAWARRRLDVQPGITGLWQVVGRNEIPFDEMVRLDYQYVRSWSLMGDLTLILRTVPVLLRPSAT